MPQRKVNPYTLFKFYNIDFCSRIQAVGTLRFNIYIYIYIYIYNPKKRKSHVHNQTL